MEVGVTATQKGMTERQIVQARRLLIMLGTTRMHNGWCIGGDEDFLRLANEILIPVVAHPPSHQSKMTKYIPPNVKVEWCPPYPYLNRNRNIVRDCRTLLAAPKSSKEELRSGTWSTVRFAKSPIMRRPVYVIHPDGNVVIWNDDGTSKQLGFEEA